MVSIQGPISKKHSLSLGYSNLNSSDKKIVKKTMKLKKRNKHVFYDIYNKTENDFIEHTTNKRIGHMKRSAYSFSHYEEDVIPKTQNNIERRLRRCESLMSESSYCRPEEAHYSSMNEEEKEDENSIEFQYGTLFGNEKVKACVNNFLSNWSTFISDIEGNNSVKEGNKGSLNEEKNYNTLCSKELITTNSGYLTPTSQKDDDYFSESSTVFDKEEIVSSENEMVTEEEEEMFMKDSPIVKDNFDDICPFDNDYFEDERMRKILNAEVLPNDYIGKIPYIPEKPMGNFGRLMKKYKF